MHVGRRGYEPVVRTSMAKGMAKLGSRAWTRASLARDASLSAVSTNRMVCWSRKLEIICCHGDGGWRMKNKSCGRLLPSNGCVHTINAPSMLEGFSTRPYRALFHLARIARPLHQGEQTHKQLPRTAGKLDNLNFPAKEETE